MVFGIIILWRFDPYKALYHIIPDPLLGQRWDNLIEEEETTRPHQSTTSTGDGAYVTLTKVINLAVTSNYNSTTTGGGNGDVSKDITASAGTVPIHPMVATTGNNNVYEVITEVANPDATTTNTLRETSVVSHPPTITTGNSNVCVATTEVIHPDAILLDMFKPEMLATYDMYQV